MSGVRKKSSAGASGLPHIDTGSVNTLLRKPGSSAVPLYQQCSALNARLARVHDFAPFLAISAREGSSRQSVDPVHALWDCLALGTPLCFLYNLLDIPSDARLDILCDPEEIDFNDLKQRKKAVAAFIMGISALQKRGLWAGDDLFTISDLLRTERNTNGFVKVVAILTQLLDRLPEHVFMPDPPMPNTPHSDSGLDTSGRKSGSFESLAETTPESGREAIRKMAFDEILTSERQYVQDLEVMQNFATALGKENLVSQDTIHRLFLNVNALLDDQRRFLIAMESVGEQRWQDQRWGTLFINHEEAFEIYEPYCSNFQSASDLLLQEEQNLMPLAHILNAKSHLPAFLIKPIQRICKYPMLIEAALKRTTPEEYPWYEELAQGLAAAKRVTERVNEAQRRAENVATCEALRDRVQDWKGHHVENFGPLLLNEMFSVSKSDVDRDYHVFLFEKIILCCKEAFPPGTSAAGKNSRVSKSNSILKKSSSGPPTPALPPTAAQRKTSPLLLKGRIFLSNVTRCSTVRKDGVYGLQVWWRGDEDLEFFTLKCRNDEQLQKWETAINNLIHTTHHSMPAKSVSRPPTLNSQQFPRHNSTSNVRSPHSKDLNSFLGTSQISRAPPPSRLSTSHQIEDEGFAEDEDLPYDARASAYSQSGFTTPNGMRRPGSAAGHSISQRPAQPPMPPTSRSQNSTPTLDQQRPQLRSKFSSVKLRSTYSEVSNDDLDSNRLRANTNAALPAHMQQMQQRMRSASSPVVPPLPTPQHGWDSLASLSQSSLASTTGHRKRSSGSSRSSGEHSSDFGSRDGDLTSPVTPYTSDTNISSYTSSYQSVNGSSRYGTEPQIKVKVHYGEDLFMLLCERSIGYEALVDKVGKKIRLCGGVRGDGQLRVKYCDEEGDKISLGSDDDVQMAFDTDAPVVTLYVS